MRRGRTGAIMPRASMSRVTVKKMKVAAARRPLGGSGARAVSSPPLRPTSSGSVISGLGAATGWGGFSVVSGMSVMFARRIGASLREFCGGFLEISALIYLLLRPCCARVRLYQRALALAGDPWGHVL